MEFVRAKLALCIRTTCTGWRLPLERTPSDGASAILPDVILLDLCLGTVQSLDLLRRLRECVAAAVIIGLSDVGDPHLIVEALGPARTEPVASLTPIQHWLPELMLAQPYTLRMPRRKRKGDL